MANEVDITFNGEDNVSGVVSGITSSFDTLGAIGTGILQGVGNALFDLAMNAIPAAWDAMKDFVNSAAEAEEVAARFDAIIAGSPLSGYSAQIKDLANQYSELTRFEDEQILSAETVLLQFQNISAEAFPDVVAATLDVAEVMGVDATSAARILGRALEDPFNAARSLRQMNIILSDEQQKQLKIWEQNGDAASASAFIMDTLKTKYGNVAEAMGGTFAGEMTKLQNTIGNIKEELGAQLLPILTPIVEQFGQLALKYAPVLADAFKKIVPYIVQFADAFMGLLSGNVDFGPFQSGLDALGAWWALYGPQIMQSARELWGVISSFIGDVGSQMGPMLIQKFNEFATWMLQNGPAIIQVIQMIVDGWKLFFSVASVAFSTLAPLVSGFFTLVLQLIQLVLQVITGNWRGAWQTLADITKTVGNSIVAAANGLLNSMAKAFGTTKDQVIQTWAANINQFGDIVSKIINIMVARVRERITDFVNAGRAIVDGLKGGISSTIGELSDWMAEQMENLTNSVTSTLGIQSPSRVYAGIGKNMMLGLAQGISGYANVPMNALQSLSNNMAVQPFAGNMTTNNYINGPVSLQVAGSNGIDLLTYR